MFTRKILACAALLVPTMVLSGMSSTAQDGQLPAQVQQTAPTSVDRFPDESPRTLTFKNSQGLASWRNRNESEVDKAVALFKAAESDDAKKDAKAELRVALTAEYETRMEQYDAHIESLEKELEAMKERLSRRRAAKEEMVDLKMKEVLANADGLGWPSGSSRSRNNLFTSPFYSDGRFPGSPLPPGTEFRPALQQTGR